MKKKALLIILSFTLVFSMTVFSATPTSASAGLAWGPKIVGNLKFYLTNPHKGWAGPKFPNHTHVNFHVDKKKSGGGYKSVSNYHIVKYSKSGKQCVYIYDSVKKKTVMDSCGDSWSSVAQKAAGAMKSFIKTVLDNADYIATIAIWGTISLVILDLIIPGDPIPILPFSNTEPENNDEYNGSFYITEPQTSNDISGFNELEEINPDNVSDIEGNVDNVILPELPLVLTSDNNDPIITLPIEPKLQY